MTARRVLLMTQRGEPLRVLTLSEAADRALTISQWLKVGYSPRPQRPDFSGRTFYLRQQVALTRTPCGEPCALALVFLTDPVSERLVEQYHARRTAELSPEELRAAEDMVDALEALAND